ncbi:CDP-glucose 4,6-dehydratase [Occallatibacter savannae]|uniref:CDP-glucose 4,6-dehydratase n=1 Tax=Occallatibacter savannae TaxID=1002691 RepID=UPI000D6A0443|nr:CDP-glucose 4,6-dehydratase [Occallatibacter savannae]
MENLVSSPITQSRSQQDRSSWEGRRVFLTGHTGFKGGWLALWLAAKGALVRGYALDPATQPNLFSDARVADILDDDRGDIQDYPKLEASLVDFEPEVVFHLAAQPLLRRSYVDPLGTYGTNVMGTANLLEAVRKTSSVRAVVCVTTDKCYQNREWAWPYRETDPLGGHDPYSSSKAAAEIVVSAFRDSYFPLNRLSDHRVAIATARAGNVIGGGDWSEDRLIPDLIRGFESGKPVLIRRPNAIRPWQHVLEPLHGYITLAEHLLAGRAEAASAFNFGPSEDDAWPVERIADRMVNLWGAGASWVRDNAPSVHEAHYLKLDSSKARAELGWRPSLNLQAALDWTLHWYRLRATGADMAAETRAQIAQYDHLLHPSTAE